MFWPHHWSWHVADWLPECLKPRVLCDLTQGWFTELFGNSVSMVFFSLKLTLMRFQPKAPATTCKSRAVTTETKSAKRHSNTRRVSWQRGARTARNHSLFLYLIFTHSSMISRSLTYKAEAALSSSQSSLQRRHRRDFLTVCVLANTDKLPSDACSSKVWASRGRSESQLEAQQQLDDTCVLPTWQSVLQGKTLNQMHPKNTYDHLGTICF